MMTTMAAASMRQKENVVETGKKKDPQSLPQPPDLVYVSGSVELFSLSDLP